MWPSSNGFVHVDECKTLSPALRNTFLPFRKSVLEKLINDRCTGTAAAPAPGMTIAGGVEGAAS